MDEQVGDHIEPAAETAEVEVSIDEDGLPILVSKAPGPPITNEEVVEAIHAAREERAQHLLSIGRDHR